MEGTLGMSWFSQVFDVTLLATIGLIVGVSLVLAFVRTNRRDVCLKCFEGYHVTLERSSGKVIWGVMELESTGLELRYRDAVQDANHVESSYVLYADEFADIQAMYRYADDLDQRDKLRREKDIQRSAHPTVFVRMWRGAQHFFSLAGDSLVEALGAIVGSLRKPAGRYINDTGEKQLRQLGATMIGSVGKSFDPLLERLIGQKVVVENRDGEAHGRCRRPANVPTGLRYAARCSVPAEAVLRHWRRRKRSCQRSGDQRRRRRFACTESGAATCTRYLVAGRR